MTAIDYTDIEREDRYIEFSGVDIEDMVTGYLDCLLWTTIDDLSEYAISDAKSDFEYTVRELSSADYILNHRYLSTLEACAKHGIDPSDHSDMLDGYYDVSDIDQSVVDQVTETVRSFVSAYPLACRQYLMVRSSSDLGQDLFLTGEGHGTGFWDRGLGDLGRYLSDASQGMTSDVYLSDGALCSSAAGDRKFVTGTLYN